MQNLDLRPKYFNEYIGQESTITNLCVYVNAALKRDIILDHVIIHGASGCGKTTLATIIANELGQKIIYTNGVNFQKVSDVISVMTNIGEGDVLFIDELHRMPKNIEEIIYSVLEDSRLDLVYGSGIDKQMLNIEINNFTLIGATTMYGNLSEPLRNRFPINITIEDYNLEDMLKITARSCKLLNINMPKEVQVEFIKVTRNTPRIANNILKRINDYEVEFNLDIIDQKKFSSIINKIGINKYGLENREMQALETINNNGPLGSDAIAKIIGTDKVTYEIAIEPYLVKSGYVRLTKSGRLLSNSGIDVIKGK